MNNDNDAGFRVLSPAELRDMNTFGVDARTPRLVQVRDVALLARLFDAGVIDADTLVLGGGSNLLIACDTTPPLLQLVADDISVIVEDAQSATVRAAAGTSWHALVLWTARRSWWGIENLALIPGTVGAAPIQNIGAYGSEVADSIVQVHAFHRLHRQPMTLSAADCGFAYRDSLFKRQPAEWIVTAVDFRLNKHGAARLVYAGLGDALQADGIAQPTPLQMAETVSRIRRGKLPDPANIGNAGSFFKNPVVPINVAEQLRQRHPDLPIYATAAAAQAKLSAAWLIERCGWKGRRIGNAGIADRHALVLVNHGQASGADLLAVARAVAADVQARFGIALEPEPRIVGATW